MSNLPPAEVLAKRLDHELTMAAFYAVQEDDPLIGRIRKAQEILAQLQETMK